MMNETINLCFGETAVKPQQRTLCLFRISETLKEIVLNFHPTRTTPFLSGSDWTLLMCVMYALRVVPGSAWLFSGFDFSLFPTLFGSPGDVLYTTIMPLSRVWYSLQHTVKYPAKEEFQLVYLRMGSSCTWQVTSLSQPPPHNNCAFCDVGDWVFVCGAFPHNFGLLFGPFVLETCKKFYHWWWLTYHRKRRLFFTQHSLLLSAVMTDKQVIKAIFRAQLPTCLWSWNVKVFVGHWTRSLILVRAAESRTACVDRGVTRPSSSAPSPEQKHG